MSFSLSSSLRAFRRPGALSFALMFAIDSLARATLTTVIPIVAYDTLGNARDVSLLFTVTGWAGVALSIFMPVLVWRLRPRWVYSLGAIILAVAPILLATETFLGLGISMAMRVFASACLLNALSLYILAYIRKQDFVRSEPLRILFGGLCWTIGPNLGLLLYEGIGPWATYALSSGAALLLLVYFWQVRSEQGPALASTTAINFNPIANIRRYLEQPRLVLGWLLSFGREVFWVVFFVYMPIYLRQRGEDSVTISIVMALCTALLFTSPIMGWCGRRWGVRRFLQICFTLCGAALIGFAWMFDHTWLAVGAMALAVLSAVGMDAVVTVPFLRAVRARERAEMTMVFCLYRDLAGLIPPALFTLLLTHFSLEAVFVATALTLFYCTWLARWVPRGM